MSKIILKQGDCMKLLKKVKDNSIDLVVTDPPYELENHGGGTTSLAERQLVSDKHINFISNGFNYDIIFNEFIRITKTPNFFIFCSNKQISNIMAWFENKRLSVTLLVWQKTNPIPLCNGKYLSDCEFCVYVRGKNAVFNNDTPFEYKKKVYTSALVPNKSRFHPTEKPIELLKRYILQHSNENDWVLDPFMGSGTTGVACKELSRNFIGFELDEKYFKIAEERIEKCE